MILPINQPENLTKARDSAAFLVSDLRAALKDSGPVEAIVILDLIRDAAEVESRLLSLLGAINE